MEIIIIETPKAGFKAIVQYKQQPVYFFRFNVEETENETLTCSETTVMLKNATYESMVAALISVQYSTDAQIALLYNYQNNPVEFADAMLEYQRWRVYCKEAARIFFGIELTLDDVKERKIAEIDAYDNSGEVNGFIIRTEGGDITEWLDTYKRNNAFRAIDSAKKLGDESISFAIGDIPVTLTVTTAEIYLAKVEKYAVTCTNVTARHKAAVNALETVEEVEAYEYKTGYPERLTFSVEELS